MLLKNAKIVNPKTNFEGISDIRIENGIVKEIANNLQPKDNEEVIDIIQKITGEEVKEAASLLEKKFSVIVKEGN